MSITAISEKCSICDEIEKAGYYAGFYCSNYYLTNYISESIRNRYSIWCTQYNDICICNGSYGMWQISTRNWFDNCNPEKIFLDRRNRQTNKKPLYWVSYLSGGAVFYNIKKIRHKKRRILIFAFSWRICGGYNLKIIFHLYLKSAKSNENTLIFWLKTAILIQCTLWDFGGCSFCCWRVIVFLYKYSHAAKSLREHCLIWLASFVMSQIL